VTSKPRLRGPQKWIFLAGEISKGVREIFSWKKLGEYHPDGNLLYSYKMDFFSALKIPLSTHYLTPPP
jgi:hypothetical protein